ncbi:hypothetical protein C8R45DRAFT_876478 [Mycena sanguinolenta]|nr:hypothetical protein C8R45DRAFT_876478 [Mycena sanguinolenta]
MIQGTANYQALRNRSLRPRSLCEMQKPSQYNGKDSPYTKKDKCSISQSTFFMLYVFKLYSYTTVRLVLLVSLFYLTQVLSLAKTLGNDC